MKTLAWRVYHESTKHSPEALRRTPHGLGANGIGAFYDDAVHRYLNLTSEQGLVVYHFAIGYPVPDPRLGA